MDRKVFLTYLKDIRMGLGEKNIKGFWNKRWLQGAYSVLDMLIEDVESGKFEVREKPFDSIYHEIFTYVVEARKNNPVRVNPETDPTILEVVGAVQQVWAGNSAREWFFGNNDYLEGARPIDFMVFGKTREVLQALETDKY